jgi:hypothetical protein
VAGHDTSRQPSWTQATDKKKPDVKTSGWEALLLSHIKAPAQGGKAGNGKPLDAEFSKYLGIKQLLL